MSLVEHPLRKSKLSSGMRSMLARGAAHWVTVKQGPLEGRHLLISGARPEKGTHSKGVIMAGHGIPPHVLEKLRHKKVEHTDVADKTEHTESDHIHGHLTQMDHYNSQGPVHKQMLHKRIKDAFENGAERVAIAHSERGSAVVPIHAGSQATDQDHVDRMRNSPGLKRGAEFTVIHKFGSEGAKDAPKIYNSSGKVTNTGKEKAKKEAKEGVKKELASKVMQHLSKFGVRDIEFNKESASDSEREAISKAAQDAFGITSKILPSSALNKTKVKLVLGKLRQGASAWAYYLPSQQSIHMTSKKGGMQPFFHEYGHAMDHALSGYNGYASESGMLKPLIDEIHKTGSHGSFINGIGKQGTKWASYDATGKYGKKYFQSGRETFARFFAEYTYHQSEKKGIEVPHELREPARFEQYNPQEMDHLSSIFEKILADNGMNKSFVVVDGRLLLKFE